MAHVAAKEMQEMRSVPQQEERLEKASSPGDSSDTAPSSENPPSDDKAEPATTREDGKIEIKEEDNWNKLGYSFSPFRKWTILTVIFWVQVSMNFNTSIYSNAVEPLTKAFKISGQAARVGQMIYLVAYAFGSELWAPWSEDLGRWPVLQLSLFLVNVWEIPCALAPNYSTIIGFRFLGGLSSAGGSVTLGLIADMWEADDQQYAVAYVVLSSVGGSVVGPIVGAFVQRWLSWHWNFWVQLIFGGVVQLAHFFLVPETRSTIILDREAKKRRKATGENIWGPNELKENRFSPKEILATWGRPFEMFAREPIVLCLSLLSGFSDALIFTFLESFQPVYEQWNFGTTAQGLAFIPVLIGYFLAWVSFFPFFARHNKIRARDPNALQPEARLYWLLYLAPLEAIGLFGFAWTSLGPAYHVHWIAPMIFSMLIGAANYAIYMATIDYMIASYGPYSASATGGNALARDFLAGIAAMYSTPFYTDVGNGHAKFKLEWPSTILACLAIIVTIPIYIFYWKGPYIREKSKFAQTLASDRKEHGGRRVESVGAKAEAGHMEDP